MAATVKNTAVSATAISDAVKVLLGLDKAALAEATKANPELAWGVLKQARRPDDILMESQFFQYQTTTTDLSDVGF